MPELLLPVVLGGVGLFLAGMVLFVLRPMLKPLRSSLEFCAALVVGALTTLEPGLSDAELAVRSGIRRSLRDFISDDDGQIVKNWAWKSVVRPLLAFATFCYLVLAELYVAALAFAAMVGSGQEVPRLPIQLPVLLGLMWAGVAVAWAEGLVDVWSGSPPYGRFGVRARVLLGSLIGAGLIAAAVGNSMFFVWRQGQIGLSNPYAGLVVPINALLGVLLFGAIAITAVSGLRVVTLVVPAVLIPVDALLLATRGAIGGLVLVLRVGESATRGVIDGVLAFSEQCFRAAAAAMGGIATTVTRRSEGRRARTGPTFSDRVGEALVEGQRAFWHLLRGIVFGVGTGIAVTAPVLGHWLFLMGREACVAVLIVKSWPWRILYPFVRWLRSFDWLRRLHIDPDKGPPPRDTLNERISRLRGNKEAGERRATLRSVSPDLNPGTAASDTDDDDHEEGDPQRAA